MKKRYKLLGLLLILFGVSGCTSNFCSTVDRTHLMEKYEEKNITKINEEAEKKGYYVPTTEFISYIEQKATSYATLNNVDFCVAKYAGRETDSSGVIKIDAKKDTLWYNFDKWVISAREDLGTSLTPTASYISFYKSYVNKGYSGTQTCITPEDGVFNGVQIEGKSWGDAFNKGIIEGLLVYPIAWLTYSLSNAFGNGGWGQILALFLVTLIVRGVLILCTFKQTLSQQKMTALQPELAKIQAKYPNANTNQYEKQKLASEQMALYKKNKINPFGTFIVLLIQFPIFIAVWGAFSGSAILADGSIWGLNLSGITGSEILSLNWFAIVLFILMSLAQIVSMKLPQFLQKRRTKKITRLSKNPAEDKNTKTMNMVSNIMMIMIIVMGISLPAAMGFYWLISAIISILQTLITQLIIEKKENSKTLKYKTK